MHNADDFADDVSDVEEALRQRMSATLEAATAVLQLVEAQAAAGGGSAGGDADPYAGLPSPTTGGARGRASNSKDAQVRDVRAVCLRPMLCSWCVCENGRL